MKKAFIIIFLGAVCIIFTSSMVSIANSYDDDALYKKCSVIDPSFEGRAENHDNESMALEDYYANYSQEKELVNVFHVILGRLTKDVYDQHKFMQKNDIDLDELRKRPEELHKLNQEEKITYLHNLRITEELFAVTAEDVKEIDNLVEKIKKDVSYNLYCSLRLYQEYINLAYKIRYTKLEMMEDASGFKEPVDLVQNYKSAFDQTRLNKGLEAKEAIRKLKDFGEGLELQTIIAYPNPFTSLTTIQIYHKGSVTCSIYDLSGKKVKELINTKTAFAYTELRWDGTDDAGNKLPKGFYIALVQTDEKTEPIKLLIQ